MKPPASVGSPYRGPMAVNTLCFGDVTLRLVHPADPDRMLDDPAVLDWNRRDDYMPYWAYLWPGAYLLAEAVAAEAWALPAEGSPRPRALEIGCGLGLAGLVAIARGLDVEFTDYDPTPLEFVVWSARENGFDPARYAVQLLDWRDLPNRHYPIILGADVIYEPRLVPLVVNLLAAMLAPDGLALIASPYRVAAERFPSAAAAAGLECQAHPATAPAAAADGRLIQGTVYRVTRHKTG